MAEYAVNRWARVLVHQTGIKAPTYGAALRKAKKQLPLHKVLNFVITGGNVQPEGELDAGVDRYNAAGDTILDTKTFDADGVEVAGLFDPTSPDDIRAGGWMVACHNDYRQDGKRMTFWLFTKGDRNVKGEGETDLIALNEVRRQLRLPLRRPW